MITAETLAQEDGIEGGFYSASSDALVGYAFPTHEGPGPNKEMPQRERPTIETLVREAVATNAVRTHRFEGPHDAILFVAVPIKETSLDQEPGGSGRTEVSGAAWLMERIPDINGGRNRELLIGGIAFGTAALVAALLAIFITTEIRRGVNSVLARLGSLGSLEGGPGRDAESAAAGPQLEEFDLVLHGIDALSLTLRNKIESERSLEAQMRHKERLSALGQFAAGIAHELRNPLGTIRLRTQMWQRSSDPTASNRSAAIILEEIDRLDRTISRLLYFSRPIELEIQAVDLSLLCGRAVAVWSQKETAAGIRFACEDEQGTTAACDPSRLLQVLDNLIENAVHSACNSADQHGMVTVSIHRESDGVRMNIADNGPGFTPTALGHALDPFFTTKETGTGLGLSISFEIVRAHGGELLLKNREGGGAIASIRLPLASRGNEAVQPLAEKETQNG